ncbi:MAG: hypothetical protein AAF762_07280, partial [Pseudomonadota bacterium]
MALSSARTVISAALLSLAAAFPTAALSQSSDTLSPHVIEQFGERPPIPDGPLSEDLQRAVETAFIEPMQSSGWGRDQSLALSEVAASGDPRLVWIISDLLRFVQGQAITAELSGAASELLGKDIPSFNAWGVVTDHLIAWDIPAPPDYLTAKRAIFTGVIPGWDQIFVEGDVDWRHVSWGGVLIDDRPFDTTDDPCNCIPAADNPPVSSAEEATWLADDAIVFGIEVNG